MIRLQLKKLLLCNLAFIVILSGFGMPRAFGSAFQNTQVGTADGPSGPTNIQTLADFENHPLYTLSNPSPQGRFFRQAFPSVEMTVDNCGPLSSTKCLKLRQIPGATGDLRPYVWWEGPRMGEQAYMQETRHANSYSFWIKGFTFPIDYDRRGNTQPAGYIKRRTPTTLNLNNPETNNMHDYPTMIVDWGQPPVWRKVVMRSIATSQRGEDEVHGYDMFLEYAQMWPNHTRFYHNLVVDPNAQPGTGYLDNMEFHYENPFMAAFPPVSIKYGKIGETVTHQLIVWNTHPTKTRNFIIQPSGRKRTDAKWRSNHPTPKDANGWPVTQTGPLAPGKGFTFFVDQDIATQDFNGNPIIDGQKSISLLSIYQDPSEIPNPQPYVRSNPLRNFADLRMDLPGVGITLKTVARTSSISVGSPPAISDLTVSSTGGSWAEVKWTSPAQSTSQSELSDDPAVMAYQIRYSLNPIADEASWSAATPIESISPVFGTGIPQQFSINGLKTATNYFAAVRAYNLNGTGGPIVSTQFTTQIKDFDSGHGSYTNGDIIPPSPPQNLTIQP